MSALAVNASFSLCRSSFCHGNFMFRFGILPNNKTLIKMNYRFASNWKKKHSNSDFHDFDLNLESELDLESGSRTDVFFEDSENSQNSQNSKYSKNSKVHDDQDAEEKVKAPKQRTTYAYTMSENDDQAILNDQQRGAQEKLQPYPMDKPFEDLKKPIHKLQHIMHNTRLALKKYAIMHDVDVTAETAPKTPQEWIKKLRREKKPRQEQIEFNDYFEGGFKKFEQNPNIDSAIERLEANLARERSMENFVDTNEVYRQNLRFAKIHPKTGIAIGSGRRKRAHATVAIKPCMRLRKEYQTVQTEEQTAVEGERNNDKNTDGASDGNQLQVQAVQVKKHVREGDIQINGQRYTEYFASYGLRAKIIKPLEIADLVGAFDIKCRAWGGGVSGQAGAIQLALARAICNYEPFFRLPFKQEFLLTRDPREVERKKVGHFKARKAYTYVRR